MHASPGPARTAASGAARETLAAAVVRVLGVDGRVRAVDLEATLSLREQALLDVLGEREVTPGAGVGAAVRLVRGPCDLPLLGLDPHPDAELHVLLSPSDADAAAARHLELHAHASTDREEVRGLLNGADLPALVAATIDAVDHTDPVLFRVEDQLYGNYDAHNNLLPKGGKRPEPHHLLPRLAHATADDLDEHETQLLGGLELLRRAGLQGEELNGRQLAPWALRRLFAERHAGYARLLAAPPMPATLADQAELLGRLRRELASTHRPWRWIDGTSFRKEERWRPHEPGVAAPLPPELVALARAEGVDPHQHHEQLARQLVRALTALPPPQRDARYAGLLEAVVRSCMRAVPSHAGMTRGFRDLRHLQDALEEGRADEVCALPLDDGFCAVFAGPGYRSPRLPLAKVLTAISRRMAFNHWHYTPGHFDQDALTVRRHFYYPPTASDLCEHGELRHTGHGVARVRHSVRSPAPLVIAGRSWPGLVDIRLMRAEGRPDTEADLVTVDRHTELIRALAQAVVELKAEGLQAPVVRGFERADYERLYPPTPAEQAPERPVGPDLARLLRVARAFAEHGVRSTSAVPVLFDTMLATRFPLPETMAFAAAGAAPLHEDTRTRYAERYGHPILPCYGLTETTCFAAASRLGGVRPGAVGRAAGIELAVLGDDGRELAAGAIGELAMRGPSVIRSYFRDDGKHAGVFPPSGWFLTGDLGRLDDDGFVYVTGRKKNMLIRGGEKVYLEDVDRCLARQPGVLDCCTVRVGAERHGDRAVAFVVGAGLEHDELVEAVVAELGSFARLDGVVEVASIPRSPSGKAQRRELEALL